ncbi:2-oxo-tetronate isomerase [Effusibacillus lacus]|uniref:Hydroxypyruvate isomerase n=1 Tax=Effusibacillus lacus TaxID=1348429 RepID=A0A292YMS8_9BACL|nr:2-oxo-tetronate isomerase [Effusibacillus lacus]TCS75374.1 hydroxypyruvate isomerase [Effusibacillus lacus]GAX89805.1 hydroxypyruvate isomerase [Effusibacillus lacus]
MFKFSANLTTLFNEAPFMDRFGLAQQAGFRHVEFQFPYEFPVDSIKREIESRNLDVVLFNFPPGDWKKGDRGIAVFPDRRQEFYESVDEAIRYALALDCPSLHCMAGVRPDGLQAEEAWKVFRENLSYAAGRLANHGITLLIEPLNPYDMAGYMLSSLDQAVQLVNELKLPNLKIQFDFYHMQRIQGELLASFSRVKELIGHVQIADNPGRHQPGTGEIHYSNIFRFLEESGYSGFVGLEYFPLGKTIDSFDWMQAHSRDCRNETETRGVGR